MHDCREDELFAQYQEDMGVILAMPEWKDYIESRGYLDKATKRQVLVRVRSKCRCEYCNRDFLHIGEGPPLIQASSWVGVENEHIRPRSKDGEDCVCNLAASCLSCHKLKTEMERIFRKKEGAGKSEWMSSYIQQIGDVVDSEDGRLHSVFQVRDHIIEYRALAYIEEAKELRKYFRNSTAD